MDKVCAIFVANSCMDFVHEIGVVGISKWDEPYSCIYDVSGVSFFGTELYYGLNVVKHFGSPWYDIYRDLKSHYDYFKSNEKSVVGINGDENLKNILRALRIETVDLEKLYDAPTGLKLKRKYDCGNHSVSQLGCAGARAAALKTWLYENV